MKSSGNEYGRLKKHKIVDQFADSLAKLELNKMMLLGALFETDF
jgi:hypothetical protein